MLYAAVAYPNKCSVNNVSYVKNIYTFYTQFFFFLFRIKKKKENVYRMVTYEYTIYLSIFRVRVCRIANKCV